MRTHVAVMVLGACLPGCLAPPDQGGGDDGESDADGDAGRTDAGDTVDGGSTLPDGLIAWYPMDDGPDGGIVEDRTGQHDATCSMCPTKTEGAVGAALAFDGAAYLDAGVHEAFDLDEGTVSGWVRIEAPPADFGASLVTKPYGSETQNSWEVWVSDTPALCVASMGVIFCTPLELEEWTEFVMTWDDLGNRTLYVNGDFVRTQQGEAILYDESPVLIGADIESGALDALFTGALDDIRIFDRVVPPT